MVRWMTMNGPRSLNFGTQAVQTHCQHPGTAPSSLIGGRCRQAGQRSSMFGSHQQSSPEVLWAVKTEPSVHAPLPHARTRTRTERTRSGRTRTPDTTLPWRHPTPSRRSTSRRGPCRRGTSPRRHSGSCRIRWGSCPFLLDQAHRAQAPTALRLLRLDIRMAHAARRVLHGLPRKQSGIEMAVHLEPLKGSVSRIGSLLGHALAE